ncbi:hypothetical protein F5B22DRAFT_114815 [Xylaria bambusicola]|uniref:uncharacterized protein n=1 Tax=Xylaria bambusicola TaxID=326684 RepID=UPI002008AD14|nr:uncharacterized protein F5B22DRAFT_114815 [Xylaria bambusicola]KAI0517238.1 hypothetical protein F5B22DRAFT_114815 [Xylaria bambusicola]
MAQLKPQRRPSAEVSSPSRCHIPSQKHSQSTALISSPSPSHFGASSAHDVKRQSGRGYGARNDSQLHKMSSQEKSNPPKRERIARTSLTDTHAPSHSQRPVPGNQKRAFPALRTRDILRSPRLQQVTGILPRKADLWADRELPPDELYRLAWAMRLPEPFPAKRPRGETQTPITSQLRKM